MPATSNYDLAIIGSGSAAFAAAIAAREQDARVVMIERDIIGGTCVNVGCVPSKLLLRAAETYHLAGHQPYAGVETHAGETDFARLVAQKDSLTAAMRQEKYVDLISEYGWELIKGEASFIDGTTLRAGGRRIIADAFLIATGARPSVPPIPGLDRAGYLTSTTAMELDHLPASLIVVGAGYIALELGQVFRQLGSEVTIIQRGPRLLPDYEPEVGDAATLMLERLGTRVLTGTHVASAEAGKRLIINRDGNEAILTAQEILVATGRQPNIEALDLGAAGVAVDVRGAVSVDESLRTTNPRVWAAGDVTLAPQFVYVAAYQGKLAAENSLTGAHRPATLDAVPKVIFTEPQIAAVGLTRRQAEEGGIEVNSVSLPLSAVARARVNVEDIGGFTLITDAATDRLLGVQIVASNAGEVIYAATLAVKFGLTVRDLQDTFAPYLTMAEGLKLGSVAFERDVTRLSCCA